MGRFTTACEYVILLVMKDIWETLETSQKPVVLYGMGNGADKIISVCEKYGIKISGVFSSDSFVRDKTFHGMPVTGYSAAKRKFGDMTVLLCFGTSLPDVIENIKRIADKNELYAPDVPVWGDTLFCREYYEKRKNEFDEIYARLADGTSEKVFENTVKYKLTGKIDYLFDCETAEDEVFDTFLRFTDRETYLDLGAYRGDTVLSFISRVKSFNKIIAVEPDRKSFAKLCGAVSHIENITCLNAVAADSVGSRTFSMTGSRGSGAAAAGEKIDCLSVDSLNTAPTFIKMDIEGAEIEAIAGAEKTILRHKPKMQIAAYHKSGDLIDIPKAVLRIRNDYKIYLRHYPCLPAWDINYFFI